MSLRRAGLRARRERVSGGNDPGATSVSIDPAVRSVWALRDDAAVAKLLAAARRGLPTALGTILKLLFIKRWSAELVHLSARKKMTARQIPDAVIEEQSARGPKFLRVARSGALEKPILIMAFRTESGILEHGRPEAIFLWFSHASGQRLSFH